MYLKITRKKIGGIASGNKTFGDRCSKKLFSKCLEQIGLLELAFIPIIFSHLSLRTISAGNLKIV